MVCDMKRVILAVAVIGAGTGAAMVGGDRAQRWLMIVVGVAAYTIVRPLWRKK